MNKINLDLNIKKFIDHIKLHYEKDKPLIFWIDLFSGAGGTSTGIHFSNKKNVFVAACVNHDKKAIESHRKNHPNTLHFTEDIRDFQVIKDLKHFVIVLKKVFPNCKIKLWASLECTNFSKAKGGQPRNADSRTLAEHMNFYIEALDPNSFWVENVKEFMSWGPLDDKGKPVSKENGKDYLKWIDSIKKYRYNFDFKLLNAADFGSYQSRERLFLQFVKIGFPFAWPETTHSKNGSTDSLFDFPKWKQVKDILDLQDLGNSIFNRKKPLSDKTINVIIKGIEKALKENESQFIFKYYGNGDNYSSLKKPSGTVTTNDRFAFITMIFNQYKTGTITSVENPIGSVTTVPKCNILNFILNPSHGGHTTLINRPGPTVIARQDKAPLYVLSALMNEKGIVDVRMRMAKISELLQMQGFPINYKLVGNQKEQKKQIGNAVDVNVSRALATADYELEIKLFKKDESIKSISRNN